MSAFMGQATQRIVRGNIEIEGDEGTVPHRGQAYELGLLGFILAAFIVGAYHAQWIPASTEIGTVGASLVLGGLLPLLAGIVLFTALRGESSLATAYCLFGAYWLYDVAVNRLFAGTVGVGASDIATYLGMGYVVWAVVMGYVTISALAKHPGVATIAALFGLSLVVFAIGEFLPSNGWTITGGYGFMIVAVLGLGATFLHRFPALASS